MQTSSALGLCILAAAAVASSGCKKDESVGRAAAERASAHAVQAVGMIDRLITGLQTSLSHAELTVGAAMATPVDTARVRNRLLDLGDDRTPVGRELSFYPAYFILAVGMDGHAVAANRTAATDWAPGLDVAAAFPCVRPALEGTAGICAGMMPTRQGEIVRSYLVSATPLRATQGGPVVGALVGSMSFGGLAKAVRVALDTENVRDRVQLSVGIWNGVRLAPSGNDNDVQAMYLVPPSLASKVPTDISTRLASPTPSTFTLEENGGQMQWGAAIARAPRLGPGAGVIVYRAPLRQ